MTGAETGKRKISMSASDLFLGSMLAICVILVVFGIACLISPNPITIQPLTYAGKIVAVDTPGRSITVQSGPNDQRTFNWKNDVAVVKCGGLQALNKVKPGEAASVSYFEQGVRRSADFVAVSCPLA